MPDDEEIKVGSPEYEEIMDVLMAARLRQMFRGDPFAGGKILDVNGVWSDYPTQDEPKDLPQSDGTT